MVPLRRRVEGIDLARSFGKGPRSLRRFVAEQVTALFVRSGRESALKRAEACGSSIWGMARVPESAVRDSERDDRPGENKRSGGDDTSRGREGAGAWC
ncbi:hypothetical protein EYF80_022079 [Liparis tanakae]|uniref:Uncharacterized protein n=1 Tax=Liparis tanakae TaxID=230148 RepID=A0A4Z2HRY6_9TELE|nr:hypothetical protein EYF80_022079 [Liparis tanakae]